MSWITFAFLTGIFESLKDISSKFGSRDASPLVLSWGLYVFSLPIVWLFASFEPIPELGPDFIWVLVVTSALHIVAVQCYMRAVTRSDLSLSMPMIMFTPALVLLTSPLMIGETVSLIGMVGVLLIVLGSYVMNIMHFHRGPLEPFKALFAEAGPRYMLVVAVIFSITSNCDRIGIASASPWFWAASLLTCITAVLSLLLLRHKKEHAQIRPALGKLITIGVVNSGMVVCHMMAVSLGIVAYVIAIKRCSVLITILLSRVIFKEGNIRERALGAAVMLIGAALILVT